MLPNNPIRTSKDCSGLQSIWGPGLASLEPTLSKGFCKWRSIVGLLEMLASARKNLGPGPVAFLDTA